MFVFIHHKMHIASGRNVGSLLVDNIQALTGRSAQARPAARSARASGICAATSRFG